MFIFFLYILLLIILIISIYIHLKNIKNIENFEVDPFPPVRCSGNAERGAVAIEDFQFSWGISRYIRVNNLTLMKQREWTRNPFGCLISYASGEVNDSKRNVSYRELDTEKVIILAGKLELPNNWLVWGQCNKFPTNNPIFLNYL